MGAIRKQTKKMHEQQYEVDFETAQWQKKYMIHIT